MKIPTFAKKAIIKGHDQPDDLFLFTAIALAITGYMTKKAVEVGYLYLKAAGMPTEELEESTEDETV